MVRDLYEGARAARMLSILITVMSIAPLLGPLLGGQILATAGWRAIFWLLVAVGFGTLVLVATLPETLPVRIPMKPAIDSETKPATCSDFIPASIPI
jgi:DHA1 family bicyclomycin/chloramphenicol resistance-like MFS transporter